MSYYNEYCEYSCSSSTLDLLLQYSCTSIRIDLDVLVLNVSTCIYIYCHIVVPVYADLAGAIRSAVA